MTVRPRLHWSAVSVGAVLIALSGYTSWAGQSSTPTPATPVIPVSKRHDAPAVAGADLQGHLTALIDLTGHVVVVNVWGSWCAPCRAEAAALEAVHRETQARGVRFLGINTRDQQTEAARTFEQRYHLTFPSLFDPDGRLLMHFPADSLNPQAIPSTLVIDRSGRIAATLPGPVTADRLKSVIAQVLGRQR
ncbi:TlpA family protein disulfide reductase [Streptomyces sp. NPDC005529]|uniref:TlpA family protein disulfide reductase n=1 Tax=unclassified Streptomyces TaxID=2593676 RepID=UPI0033ADF648